MRFEMMDKIIETTVDDGVFTAYTKIVNIGDYDTEEYAECVRGIKSAKQMIEIGKLNKVYRVINADMVELARKAGYKIIETDDTCLMEIDFEKEYTDDFRMIESSRLFMYWDTQKRM